MENKFKTNIKCSACVAKVTPYLNDVVGENQWNVDLAATQRTLTINTQANESMVKDALKKAGYTAEKI
jgi:copper chaperone